MVGEFFYLASSVLPVLLQTDCICVTTEWELTLTKDDFVQHIIDNDPGFDMFSFEGFRPTLEIIKSIVEDADRN